VDKLNRLARTGDSAVNAFTNRGAETRSSREGLEVGSIDDLAAGLTEVTMTRSRAIKLAGAALLGGTGMMMLFQSPAEARRRRRKRRRKRKVSSNPALPQFTAEPGGTDTKTVEITNHQDTPVYILPDAGSGTSFSVSLPGVSGPLTQPVEIAPGATVPVEVTFSPALTASPGDVQIGSLPILDAVLDGELVKAIPLKGTVTASV
jgi:hypothetical protein